MKILRDIPVGSEVTRSDIADGVPCVDAVSSSLRRIAGRSAVVASRALASGTIIRPLAHHLIPDARRGSAARLRETNGAVVIERSVEIAQPGYKGERVFVRTADGAVFAATLVDDK